MAELDDLPESVRGIDRQVDDLNGGYVDSRLVKRLWNTVRAELLRLSSRVQELQALLDQLHGEKFSDRCYHALKSRAETAEARVKELERERDEWKASASYLNSQADSLKSRAERVESELAALKARIAEAPTHVAEWMLAYGLTFNDADGTLDGHRVALLDMGKEG